MCASLGPQVSVRVKKDTKSEIKKSTLVAKAHPIVPTVFQLFGGLKGDRLGGKAGI